MRLVLHNRRTDYVMIQSEVKYLIGVQVGGTVIRNHGLGTTRPKTHVFLSGPGGNLIMTKWFGVLAGLGTEPNRTARNKPDRWHVNLARCLHLA
jgi:hypothetical protein